MTVRLTLGIELGMSVVVDDILPLIFDLVSLLSD